MFVLLDEIVNAAVVHNNTSVQIVKVGICGAGRKIHDELAGRTSNNIKSVIFLFHCYTDDDDDYEIMYCYTVLPCLRLRTNQLVLSHPTKTFLEFDFSISSFHRTHTALANGTFFQCHVNKP